MASKVSYKIDMVSVLQKAYPADSFDMLRRKREIANDPVFKLAFGEAVINKIIERTQDRKIDKNNQPFKPYSDSYVNSLVFKIYGKSRSNVNLTLTSEMLSSLRSKATRSGIVIDLIGQFNNDKAHGHIYGIKSKRFGRVVRDFLGLPDDELVSVFRSTMREFRSQGVNATAIVSQLATAFNIANQGL